MHLGAWNPRFLREEGETPRACFVGKPFRFEAPGGGRRGHGGGTDVQGEGAGWGLGGLEFCSEREQYGAEQMVTPVRRSSRVQAAAAGGEGSTPEPTLNKVRATSASRRERGSVVSRPFRIPECNSGVARVRTELVTREYRNNFLSLMICFATFGSCCC